MVTFPLEQKKIFIVKPNQVYVVCPSPPIPPNPQSQVPKRGIQTMADTDCVKTAKSHDQVRRLPLLSLSFESSYTLFYQTH